MDATTMTEGERIAAKHILIDADPMALCLKTPTNMVFTHTMPKSLRSAENHAAQYRSALGSIIDTVLGQDRERREGLERRLLVVLGADLVAQRASGSVVGGGVQKMVLVVLVVCEGMPMTLAEVAERAGYDKSTVGRAIEALMRQGVVRCQEQMAAACGRPGWCEYRVEEQKL